MSGPAVTIPATKANRSFSKLLRAVRGGARVTITSHGEPVAELGPVGPPEEDLETLRRRQAHLDLVEHIRSVKPRVVGQWTRDELYERG